MTESIGWRDEQRMTQEESAPEAENPEAAVFGLAAMIVVVGGLTWLFTSNPESSPMARSSSQERALSLNEKVSPSAPTAAISEHEEPADKSAERDRAEPS